MAATGLLVALLVVVTPGEQGMAAPVTVTAAPVSVVSAPATGADVPASTQAVPAAGGLSVTAMTPGVVTRDTDLTVTGVLTAGTTALAGPRVSLVRGGDLLASRQEVTDWSTSTDAAGGALLAGVDPAPTVAAGASVRFTLTVPAGTVRDSAPYGVLPVAVQVSSDQGTTSVHTFLGWYDRKEYEQLDLSVVAPVTLPADTSLYADDAAVRARAWQRDLGPGSRIDRLLRGTDAPGVPVTWVVDPAVLGPGTSGSSGSSGGSSGTGGSGSSPTTPSTSSTPGSPTTPATTAPTTPPTTTPTTTTTAPGATPTEPGGSGDAVAAAQQRLADRLAAGAARHPLWALPYADPDLAATLVSPSDPLVGSAIERAAGLTTRLGGAPVTTGVAWPVDGGLPPERESGLRTAYGTGLRGALVSSSTLPSTSGYSATSPQLSPGGVAVVGWDDAMSTLTTRTRTVADGVLATQELVAQTATLLGQSPGVSRSFLIALPRTVDPSAQALRSMLTGLAAVPWVRLGSAATQLGAAATSAAPLTSMATSTWPTAQPAITSSLRRRVDGTRSAVEAVATLLPRSASGLPFWEDSLDQVVSTRWRGHAAAPVSLLSAATRWVGSATRGIRVVGQDTNFLADEGILQVTVVNDLTEPVAGLVLRLSPSSPRLRVLEQPAAFPIAARSRATVRVRVRAVAAGLVPVTVSLQSGDGLPVGTSAQLNIRANPPGRAFYLGSGAVLVLLLVVGVGRAVRRRRRPVSAT